MTSITAADAYMLTVLTQRSIEHCEAVLGDPESNEFARDLARANLNMWTAIDARLHEMADPVYPPIEAPRERSHA